MIGYAPIDGYPDRSRSLVLAENQPRPRAIAADEKRVFWTNEGPPEHGGQARQILHGVFECAMTALGFQ